MIFLRLLSLKDYAYLAAILFLSLFLLFQILCGGREGSTVGVPGSPAPPDTVVVKDLPEQIIKEASREPTFVEKFTEREIQPDRVEVVDGRVGAGPGEAGEDTVVQPPDWGMYVVEKERSKLVVSALRRCGTPAPSGCTNRAQKLTYTLPNTDSDFVLRSGGEPPRLRVDRRFSLIKLDLRATVFGGVELSTGEPAVGLTLEGPISVGRGRLRVSPAAVIGFGEGVRVGGVLKLQVGG